MRTLNAILLATVIAAATAFGFCDVRADTRAYVAVMDETLVRGEKVYLKDVARIEGPAALQKRLGATYLAYAPNPGKHKILRGSWIESKVRSQRWLPENTVLRIPEYVRIGRACQSIQDEDFLRRYTGFIAQQINDPNVDFGISRFRVIGNGPLPEGDVRVDLRNQADKKPVGHVSLSAFIRVNGKIERRVVLSGWVDRFEKIVCTVRPLLRHAILAKEDLCFEMKNISKLPTNVTKTLEAIVGKRLKHAVKAGSVLMANTVEEPPLIEKGDRVTIIAESSTIRVTAIGIAKSKGSAGEQIRVMNSMSNKEIIASVVNGSTVRVEF